MDFTDYNGPYFGEAVDIFDREKCTRKLEEMAEALKGAAAMRIGVVDRRHLSVVLYGRNEATRKARLQLSITLERSRTSAAGDSVWLDIERYAALFKHGTRRDFIFLRGDRSPDLTCRTFVGILGLLIAQNAASIECLRLEAKFFDRFDTVEDMFFKQLFSLDVWQEAFPSLQRAYLIANSYDTIDVPPHLMKHVRGLEQVEVWLQPETLPPAYVDWTSSMIRNNAIEEVEFPTSLLGDAKLLDDALRRVRSFEVEIASSTSLDHLARSFERTRAEGDKLECVSVRIFSDDLLPRESFTPTAVETIIRLRPNLQVLNVKMRSSRDFVGVCQAVASSTLTAFTCHCGSLTSTRVEAAVVILGELLQHSTIRVLELSIDMSSNRNNPDNLFVQGVAEGLRATRLRRFHLTMSSDSMMFSYQGVSVASMAKLYESVRENRSLTDVQLNGQFWDPWREPRRRALPRPPPCPFSFFESLPSRNLSQLLMSYAYTLPAGLWPLILESASSDATILYCLLTCQPHLVTADGGMEWSLS